MYIFVRVLHGLFFLPISRGFNHALSLRSCRLFDYLLSTLSFPSPAMYFCLHVARLVLLSGLHRPTPYHPPPTAAPTPVPHSHTYLAIMTHICLVLSKLQLRMDIGRTLCLSVQSDVCKGVSCNASTVSPNLVDDPPTSTHKLPISARIARCPAHLTRRYLAISF